MQEIPDHANKNYCEGFKFKKGILVIKLRVPLDSKKILMVK